MTELRYQPWGATRYTSGATPTSYQYTGQRNDATGLYFYNARYYDPALGRFLAADSTVPGAAAGAGGGAATLGYDSRTRLTPLTVNLGEFAAQLNAENREVLQFGPFFQWDSKVRQEHNVPMGPANPQALNRYAYCLNNPLRYVDPTGHYEEVWQFSMSPDLLQYHITLLETRAVELEFNSLVVQGTSVVLGTYGMVLPPLLFLAVPLEGVGLCMNLTKVNTFAN